MKMKLFYVNAAILLFFSIISCTNKIEQKTADNELNKPKGISNEIIPEEVIEQTVDVLAKVQESKKNITINNQIDISNMVFVPAGEFMMGKNDTNEDHHHHGSSGHEHHGHKDIDFGKPAHKVYLDSYYIDKFEVTNGEYKKFIDAGGYKNKEMWTEEGWLWLKENKITEPLWWSVEKTIVFRGSPDYPDNPVTGISWYEAMAYAKWIGKSLPTEAQWEKAARGTNVEAVYPWGIDEPDCLVANFCIDKYEFCEGSTSIVGKLEKGKSPYGVYDMSGNVWEWCRDWYSSSYYTDSPYKNPVGAKTGTKKVLRGGAWLNAKEFISSTYRQKVKPDLRNYFNGFRCVVESSKVKAQR